MDRYNLQKTISKQAKNLMLQKKSFMRTIDDDKIYEGDAFDDWNAKHGLTSTIHRVIFHHIKDKHGIEGYAIKDTEIATTLMIPDELVATMPV